MIKTTISCACLVTMMFCVANGNEISSQQTLDRMLGDIEALKLPTIQLSYIDNIEATHSSSQLTKQKSALRTIQSQLAKINYEELSQLQKRDIDLLHYEIELNLEHIALGQKWHINPNQVLSEQSLRDTTYGKDWYQYFLKRWIDITVTPEQLMSFGEAEVKRVHHNMQQAEKRLKQSLTTDNQNLAQAMFFLDTKEQVHNAFLNEKKHIARQVEQCFPFIDKIPDIAIKAGTNPNLAQTPGYYSINQFSYNYFDKPFNIRQIAWLYLHEAIPGHHYQVALERQLPKSKGQEVFTYRGYREGWAAYVEELINECGFYNEPHDELGKWEWDIVRSVRIVLDVGLNYYDWSDEKALSYWQKFITGQDDIAQREIARMKRWPAQVITYKYGANVLLKIKQEHNITTKADLKKYHEKIMRLGPMPFSLLEKAFSSAR